MGENFYHYFKNEWGLSESDINSLADYFRKLEVDKGDVIVRKGKNQPDFYFVEKGMLRVYSTSEDGKDHILHFAPENWIVGDRGSIYFNEAAFFSIDVIEDSVIMRFDMALMDQLSVVCQNFRQNNDRLLHNHIRHLNRRINLLRVPQWMVASYLGIAPESLSRVRRELAKENFRS